MYNRLRLFKSIYLHSNLFPIVLSWTALFRCTSKSLTVLVYVQGYSDFTPFLYLSNHFTLQNNMCPKKSRKNMETIQELNLMPPHLGLEPRASR